MVSFTSGGGGGGFFWEGGVNSISYFGNLLSNVSRWFKLWFNIKFQVFSRLKLFKMVQNILYINMLVWGGLGGRSSAKVVCG